MKTYPNTSEGAQAMKMDAKCFVHGEAYRDGYRNGKADRLLGLRLAIALTSSIPGYAVGYKDGQQGEPK